MLNDATPLKNKKDTYPIKSDIQNYIINQKFYSFEKFRSNKLSMFEIRVKELSEPGFQPDPQCSTRIS